MILQFWGLLMSFRFFFFAVLLICCLLSCEMVTSANARVQEDLDDLKR